MAAVVVVEPRNLSLITMATSLLSAPIQAMDCQRRPTISVIPWSAAAAITSQTNQSSYSDIFATDDVMRLVHV